MNLPMPTVEVDTTEVDTTKTSIAEQMAFERSLEIHLRNQAVQQAHEDAVNTVGSNMLAAALGTGFGGGDPRVVGVATIVTGLSSSYQSCYVSCHNQNPPKEPPVPEIKTEEEEEEEKKKDN